VQPTVPDPSKIALLERRLWSLESQVFHLSPPEIAVTPEVERYIARFREDHHVEGPLETAISKRDVMFRFLEYFQADVGRAYWEYLRTGLVAFEAFDRLMAERFGGFSQVDSVLDFASGYGRITRFLVRVAPLDRLWVSDVKPKAVEFQREKFGVQGFAAPADPAQFPAQVRFDAIFVASFFSHVPERDFAAWLRALYGALSQRGMLAFSVNDVSLLKEERHSGTVTDADTTDSFVFRPVSEEALFAYLDDVRLEGETYGTTYVSESYVRDVMERLGCKPDDVRRHPRGLWDIQDLYVVTKGGQG
jgi:SAM-dependent methyltransferase